jgi:hypothetical protein
MIATTCDVGSCEAVTTWPHPIGIVLAVVLVVAVWRWSR